MIHHDVSDGISAAGGECAAEAREILPPKGPKTHHKGVLAILIVRFKGEIWLGELEQHAHYGQPLHDCTQSNIVGSTEADA